MDRKSLQTYINQVFNVTGINTGILDADGCYVVCTGTSPEKNVHPHVSDAIVSDDAVTVCKGTTFRKVFDKEGLELILFIDSDSAEAPMYLELMAIGISGIGRSAYDLKTGRSCLFRDIIEGNVPPGEMQIAAKDFRISYNVPRVAYVVMTPVARDAYPYEVLESIFPNKAKDCVIVMNDKETVLIKEIKSANDPGEIEKYARIILDTLKSELLIKVKIGTGNPASDLRGVGKSYNEARMALEIGGIFSEMSDIHRYSNLGIGRLIYNLSPELCRLFIEEAFNNGKLDSLDDEAIFTVQKFFENNLNISETSRKLYVHRNTLVYRLDRIQKITGLDLKTFEDAMIFKVSMMIRNYLGKVDNAGNK